MTQATHAVFLSYASQDAAAARALVAALRAAGVEVWFDQNELVGGDAWDAKIRRQIAECALFIPVISAATQARREGYFRIEWKLAAQRTHAMADGTPFLLPVVIDGTKDGEALAPAEFKAVQWTRLPGGEASPAFCSRVRSLLDGAPADIRSRDSAPSAGGLTAPARGRLARRWSLIAGALACAGVAAWAWLGISGSASTNPPGVSVAKSHAATSLDKAAQFPRDADLRQAMALIEALNGTREDCRLAEELANKTLALRPNDPEAVIVCALINNTFINRGFDRTEERFKQARSWSERALKLAPDHPEALYALGWNLTFRNADPARAVTLLEQAIKLQPDRSRYHQALVYFLRTEQPERALKLAREASQRFPDDALMRYQVALVLVSMRSSLDEYETALDETLAVGPVSAALLAKARLMLLRHGDAAEAKRLLDLLPADFRLTDRPVRELYFYARATGQWEAGLQALRAFPGDWLRDFSLIPKRMLIGDLLAWQGKPELSRREYEAALIEIAREKARDPQADVLLPEAWTLLRLGRRGEARARAALLYESAPRPFRIAGTNPSLLNEAFILLQMDAREQALTLLREASVHPWSRELLRNHLRLDPAMMPWRDDAEIKALLAPPPSPAAQASAMPPATAPDDKSLAVLPLENLSPDPENAFFTEGMHSEIIATLGRIPDLRVVSRGSALAFKNSPLPPPEIAAKLGVANLVTGSVRRAGDRLRIALELRRARDDALLWSQTFDRDLKDVFAIQSEIAAEVARVLQARATKGSFVNARFTSANPQAYEEFLAAFALFNRIERSDWEAIFSKLEKSLSLDPNFASAAALYANALEVAARQSGDPVERVALARACKKWAERAAELMPGGAGDHGLAAYYNNIERDFDKADRYIENIIRALPNESWAYNFLALNRNWMGREKEAIIAIKKAISLDPYRPVYWQNYLLLLARLKGIEAHRQALTEMRARGFEPNLAEIDFQYFGALPANTAQFAPPVAVLWLSRARAWEKVPTLVEQALSTPKLGALHRWTLLHARGEALSRLGRTTEAEAAFKELLSLTKELDGLPEIGVPQQGLRRAIALARVGRKAEALREITVYSNQVNGAGLRGFRLVSAQAELLAYLGETDAALTLIAKILREPSGLTVPMLRVDPAWDNLRADPRFQALLDDPANSAPL